MKKYFPMQFPVKDDAYDRFLKTLSNRTRLAVIYTLLDGPKNVNELTDELKINQTTISHALKRLLTCGFVHLKKEGREHIYSVNKKTIKPLLKLIEDHVKKYCLRCNE